MACGQGEGAAHMIYSAADYVCCGEAAKYKTCAAL